MPPSLPSGPILVIGSAGAVGREVCGHLRSAGMSVLPLGRAALGAEVDLETLLDRLEQAAPAAVINCLSMTGLDKCFRETSQAFEANALFPIKLAAASKIHNLPVIHFSTENVFPCNINELMYREGDKPQPNTVYGLSKLAGEAADLRASAPFHVIRLPMLYGPSNDRQIVARLVRELLRGNEVAVSTDVFTTPVYTPDVAGFVLGWLKGERRLSPVVHLTSGHRTSLHELIGIIGRGVGATGRIRPVLSSQFPSLEAKPLHGGLSSDLIEPFPFDAAVARYVDWIKQNESVVTNGR